MSIFNTCVKFVLTLFTSTLEVASLLDESMFRWGRFLLLKSYYYFINRKAYGRYDNDCAVTLETEGIFFCIYQAYFSSSSNVSVELHIKTTKVEMSKYFRPDAFHTTETQQDVSSDNNRHTAMKRIYIKFLSLLFPIIVNVF